MSTAQYVSTHTQVPIPADALAEIRQAFPELHAQDAFLLPTWFYRQTHWIEDPLRSENALYNFPVAIRISGPLDPEVLRQSLAEMQRRHEVLRSVFRIHNGHAFHVVVPPLDLALNLVDLSGIASPARDAKLTGLMVKETHCPFDLTTDVLLRATLYRLSVAEHVLLLNTHHLVCDDWSSGILLAELFALYDFLAAGAGERPAEITFRYGDFIRWQQERARDDARRQARWKTKLASAKGFWHLHPDCPRPKCRTNRSATVRYVLPGHLEAAIKHLIQEHKVTFFMALLAGFQSLLHLYSGDTDVGVGTCAANRPLPAVESVIGRFANDLVVRTDYSGDPSFREVLSRTRDAALEAYGYQDLPFGAILEELIPVANPSATPLFQSIFILQNAPKVTSRTGAITAQRMLFNTETAKYDVAVWVGIEELVHFAFEYNRDLFREETITRMIKDYEAVLATMVAEPAKRLSEARAILCPSQQEPGRASLAAQDRGAPTQSIEDIEAGLIALWREILGVSEIRVSDDFFTLGGDSLRATQLLCRVEQRFGAYLRLVSLFSTPTIQQQALAIARMRASEGVGGNTVPEPETSSALTSSGKTQHPTSVHKSVLRRTTNRILHLLCRFVPGATTLRPFLHRLRGIRIGKEVWIGDDVYLENEYPECVEIHDCAMVSLRCTIVAHTRGAGKVIIGRNAFIGAGSTIVTTGNRPLVIGEGAVVMASSLVTTSIAPYTLYGCEAAKPLARITKPFTASLLYEDFIATLRPL